jgi:hypothetical protein
MRKWLLGSLLGGFLGIFDGLTALISAPETAPGIMGIVIGSMIKGLIAGWLIGYFAQKVNSLPLGILFGLAVGAFLAFLVAWMQYASEGKNYFWQIMLPGAVVGIIVGYATQRHGTLPRLAVPGADAGGRAAPKN